MKLFANASAFPKVSGVVESKTIRCFPGILSIQSSFSWCIGWKFVRETVCPYAVAVQPATAAAKAAAPALKRERNDRLSEGDRETRPLMCSSLSDGNYRLNEWQHLNTPLQHAHLRRVIECVDDRPKETITP